MATHLCAWSDVVPTDTETELSAITDDVLSIVGGKRFAVRTGLEYVHYAAALSTNLTKARLNSPSLEVRRTQFWIIPQVSDALKFPLSPYTVLKPPVPQSLAAGEHLSALGTASANVRVVVLAGLGPATLPPVPAGERIIVRCTSNTTLRPFEWTTCSLTPDISLPVGTYTLVGMLPISANAIAARAIILGQVNRPGVPALAGDEAAVKKCDPLWLTAVQQYAMGSFPHTDLPQVQFLSSAADTSEVVYLYLVKTA
jgi:hypothetical protein